MHLIAFQYACFLTQLVLCVIRGRVSATEREALRPALTSSGIESFEVKCWDNLSNWRKEKKTVETKRRTKRTKRALLLLDSLLIPKNWHIWHSEQNAHAWSPGQAPSGSTSSRDQKSAKSKGKKKQLRRTDVKRWSLNFDSTIEKTKLKR